MQITSDTSSIEQTHGYALFLRCLQMKVRVITAGLKNSVSSLMYELCTDVLFFSPMNTCILRILSYKLVSFSKCKLRSKKRVSSGNAGMKEF